MRQNPGDLSLPPLTVLEEYLWLFCSSHLKLEFPVVDPATFRDTLRVAYDPPPDACEVDCAIARASVFAFVSVISLFVTECSPAASHIDNDSCATKARHLLSMNPEELGVTMQTALMLVSTGLIYYVYSARLYLTCYFISRPFIYSSLDNSPCAPSTTRWHVESCVC